MGRTTRLRIWGANVALLMTILALLMVLIGPGIFTIDEQAYRFQTELVNNGTWGLPYPTADVIDQNLGAPMINSERGDESWYPAARHPAYIQLLRAGQLIDDFYGPVLISVLGVVLAAIGIELVARWLAGPPNWTTFWFAGLASPAAFHGLVTWAHAPALGLVAIGLAALLRATPHRRSVTLLGISSLAGAILLRSDGPLAVMAIGAGFLVAARHDRRFVFRLVAAGAAGVVGLTLQWLWHGAVVEATTVAGRGSGRGIDIDRYLSTTVEIFLSPGSGVAALRLISVMLLATAVGWYKRTAHRGSTVTVALVAVATVCGAIGALDITTYGSLLPAAPMIAVGLLGLSVGDGGENGVAHGGPSRLRSPADSALSPRQRRWVLATMAVVGMVGPVLATVSGGGGLGWGGRYVLLALAPVVPLAMSGMAELWRTPSTRAVAVGAMVVTVAVQGSGARILSDYHRFSLAAPPILAEDLPALGQEFDLIATFDPRIGRVAPQAASSAPLISVRSSAELTELLTIAADGDLSEVAIVSFFDPRDLELPADWVRTEYRDQPLQVLVVGR